eukprot:1106072-Rhodomonas_salina.2
MGEEEWGEEEGRGAGQQPEGVSKAKQVLRGAESGGQVWAKVAAEVRKRGKGVTRELKKRAREVRRKEARALPSVVTWMPQAQAEESQEQRRKAFSSLPSVVTWLERGRKGKVGMGFAAMLEGEWVGYSVVKSSMEAVTAGLNGTDESVSELMT